MNAVRFLSTTAAVSVLLLLPVAAIGQVASSPSTATTATGAKDCAQGTTQPGCPGSADTSTTDNADGSAAIANGTIVVTGSRIARPTLSSPVPITSITALDLLSTGTINIGDALNHLPALRSTFSQANSTRFIGTSGLNLLDLRGLGTARTLVLVNGRRHITSSPGDYLVDTNTIPDDLLERVDIVTGGSSAIYGSDAVAGVVNFILKRNFDGIKVAGQGSISSRGDRGSYFGSVTVGRNFAGGRGNIAVAAEFSRANALYNVDRDGQTGAFSGRSQFNLRQSTIGEPVGGNGMFDNAFFTGVRNGNIADGGLVTAVCDNKNPSQLANANRCRPSSTPFVSSTNRGIGLGQRYVFDANGNLTLSAPTVDFRDITTNFGAPRPAFGSSNTIGGLGSTLRNTGQLDPQLERYSVNMLAHFDVTPAFSPFVEAKYVRIYANQEGQPSFFSPISGTLGLPELRCSNAFLTASSLATLQSIGRCANPATDSFATSRFNVDFGGRGELERRETYRIVAGVQGTFNSNWKYELAVNYGRLNTSLRSLNNLVLADINGNDDGFALAYNAVNAPAGFAGSNFVTGPTGNKVICAVNSVTNVRPDCVPVNLFGVGAPSRAALNFINTTSTRIERATELDLTANLAGDLGKLFSLPGGPVAFAVGSEYRQETAFSAFDPLTASGGTFLNAIQPFTPPKLTVKEAYGELNVPLVKDVPFIHELTLSGAARVSKYNTTAGTTFTYNGAVVYAPVEDLRFRAGYARAVRVPTQSDLYSTLSQNFAQVGDPCDAGRINNGSATRSANCTALGVPAGFVNTVANSQSTSYQSGGNSKLVPETSTSYTIGGILQPHWVPGLSLTVDYYNIKVTNLIAGVSFQTILNQCADLPTIANSFCALVNARKPTGEFATPYAGVAATVNFAKQTTAGIDADLAYNRRFESGARISLRGIFSYVIDRTNYLDPVFTKVPTRQLSNLGDPQIQGQFSAEYETSSGINFRYQFLYVGRQTIGLYQAQHSYNGNPPTNPNQYPQVYYPAITYHNARIGFNVQKKFEFYLGVDNIFDQLPPLGLTGTGGGSGIYSNVGRQYYSGFKVHF